MMVVPALSLNS